MWFRSRPRTPPAALPYVRPRLDGTGWPEESALGRPSFDTATFAELGQRSAHDPEAHAVADRLVADLLPLVPTGVQAEDEPYLRKTFRTAAQIGAGLGVVERDLGRPDVETIDRRVAGALWQARRRLPAMPPDWSAAAAYFLLAGYAVARSGTQVVDELRHDLTG
jgi:hypothetical protein